VRVLNQWDRRIPFDRRDVGLTLVVTALSFTAGIDRLGTWLGWTTAQRPFDALAVVLILGHALPLLVLGRAPAASLLAISAAFGIHQALGYSPTVATIGLYLALFNAGSCQLRHRNVLMVVEAAGYVALGITLSLLGSTNSFTDYVLFFSLPAGCWLLGAWTRRLLRDQGRVKDDALKATMQDERERIARELHDVVTHHVTAMVMQSEAARYLPEEDRDRLLAGYASIATTGRRALGDLRELLGVLSPEHDRRAPRVPPTGSVLDLVEHTRLVGQPVEFVSDGAQTGLNDVGELAAYRVVQEGLTNALKHAPGRRTRVRVSGEAADRVLVEVLTEGGGGTSRTNAPVTSGRGLVGLHRRVQLAGGELTAQPEPDGGFVLSAVLPREQEVA
jgi:signal transduction histidine kinase